MAKEFIQGLLIFLQPDLGTRQKFHTSNKVTLADRHPLTINKISPQSQ